MWRAFCSFCLNCLTFKLSNKGHKSTKLSQPHIYFGKAIIDYRTIIGLKNISEVMYVFDKWEQLLPQEVTTDTESPVSVCDIKHNDSNRRNQS